MSKDRAERPDLLSYYKIPLTWFIASGESYIFYSLLRILIDPADAIIDQSQQGRLC